MLFDNILSNLNISRSVIDSVHAGVKITYNTKMNHIIVFFSDYYNSIFIDRVPYKHKKLAASWCFNNSFSDKRIFSSCAKSYLLNLKMWKIIIPALKKDMFRPFLKTAPYMRMDLNRDQEIYQKF